MKLFIAGDSTASIKLDNKRPESGWGEYLHTFVSPNLEIKNYAVNARSTKSYIAEGRLFQIETEISEGDYLLVQFGHNDSKDDKDRFTEPYKDYMDNLERFAVVATNNHATPIFISSITRRKFIDGKLDKHALGDYPNAMKTFCKTYNYPFIDMFSISQKIVSDLGEEGSKPLYNHLLEGEHINYPEGKIDDTHFSPYGAKLFASLIAIELRKFI